MRSTGYVFKIMDDLILTDNKEENDQIRTKSGENVQANPITKVQDNKFLDLT